MSLKVLICDADRRFTDRAARFLTSHGHHVLVEALPTEAFDLAARWKPDVVVVSSESVAGENGEMLTDLRKIDPRPAVLLTGQLDRFDAAWQAWQRGADELLLKPVLQAWEIHTAIISAINRAAPQLARPAVTA